MAIKPSTNLPHTIFSFAFLALVFFLSTPVAFAHDGPKGVVVDNLYTPVPYHLVTCGDGSSYTLDYTAEATTNFLLRPCVQKKGKRAASYTGNGLRLIHQSRVTYNADGYFDAKVTCASTTQPHDEDVTQTLTPPAEGGNIEAVRDAFIGSTWQQCG